METRFEWNKEKAKSNFKKHNIDFKEASSIFRDPLFITALDKEHSRYEERYVTIGLSNKNRVLIVAHADSENKIRIISARKVTKNEKRFYQEAE